LLRPAVICSVDSTGSAVISDTDISQSGWTASAGQTVVSQCPPTADGHGAVSRFGDGLTVRSSKCVAELSPRMTSVVTDCQGMTYRRTNIWLHFATNFPLFIRYHSRWPCSDSYTTTITTTTILIVVVAAVAAAVVGEYYITVSYFTGALEGCSSPSPRPLSLYNVYQ